MSRTNWKKLTNPDYLGAYSLDDGAGKYVDIAVTISRVVVEEVTGSDGKKEKCVVSHFAERDIKPMVLNVTNMKTLEKLFKSKYIEDWAGKKIIIGVESVKAFGDVVDALRIRKRIPESQGVPKCADCGKEVAAAMTTTGAKLEVAQVVAVARKRFGMDLCADCMKARDAAAKSEKSTEAEGRDGENDAD